MKVEFCDLRRSLDIDKLSRLKIITIEDFGRDYQDKIDFQLGAHQIKMIFARQDSFNTVFNFLIHVMSMEYANRVSYNLPENFYERTYLLNKMKIDQFKLYIDSYFDGFLEHLHQISPNLELFEMKLNIQDFKEGYKIEISGTGQVLMCRTSKYYLYFISQSIN